MNKIPNGGFPPLKLKKTIEKKTNNKNRSFSKPMQNNINIRQILFNNYNKNNIIKNNYEQQLEEVNDL
jgi:hypothetical protein